MDDNLSIMKMEEVKFQRIADAAKIAQRSVETLATLLNRVLEDIDAKEEVDTEWCRNRMAEVPYLRRIYLRPDDKGESRIVMDLPFFPSPSEEDGMNRELAYLRRLQEASYPRYGAWRRTL